jgi:hypothetical protein
MYRLTIPVVVLCALSNPAEAQPEWRVVRAPDLRIPASTSDGTPRYGTATWATWLPNGEVALADGGDAMVRIFAADGSQRRTIGRSGRGPGEFASLGWIGRCGTDSLFAWDFVQAKMHILEVSTGIASEWPERVRSGTQVQACSREGELAMSVRFHGRRGQPMAVGSIGQGGGYRIWRDTFDVQTYDAGGVPRRDIAGALRSDGIVGTLPDGRQAGIKHPGGLATMFAVTGDLLVIATTDSGHVRSYGPDGRERHAFVFSASASRPTVAQYHATIDELMKEMPPTFRKQASEFARAVPVPERGRRFHQLVAADDGLLWFAVSGPGARTTEFRIHRPTGEAIGRMVVPAPITVFEISNDRLLGRTEDVDGEQELVAFRFTRP